MHEVHFPSTWSTGDTKVKESIKTELEKIYIYIFCIPRNCKSWCSPDNHKQLVKQVIEKHLSDSVKVNRLGSKFTHSVMSHSLQPHGLQQARLLCPSASPRPCSIESVMPSNRLILCCPLLLLPSIFPSIRVFSIRNWGSSRKSQVIAAHPFTFVQKCKYLKKIFSAVVYKVELSWPSYPWLILD